MKTKHHVYMLVIVAVGLLAAGLWFLVYKNVPAAELAELAATEGDQVLREPMRRPVGGPKVLLVALDCDRSSRTSSRRGSCRALNATRRQ